MVQYLRLLLAQRFYRALLALVLWLGYFFCSFFCTCFPKAPRAPRPCPSMHCRGYLPKLVIHSRSILRTGGSAPCPPSTRGVRRCPGSSRLRCTALLWVWEGPPQSRTGAGAHKAVGWDRNRSKVCAWVSVRPLVTKQLGGLGIVFLVSQVYIMAVSAQQSSVRIQWRDVGMQQLHLTVWNNSYSRSMFECGEYAPQS